MSVARRSKHIGSGVRRPNHSLAIDRLAGAIGLGRLGRTIARRLVRRGITTIAQLKRPAVLNTLPKAGQVNVLYGTTTRAPLQEASEAANEIKTRLEFCIHGGGRCVHWPTYVVGSVRRRLTTVKDLDILVVQPARSKVPMKTALQSLRLRPSTSAKVKIMTIYARGARKCAMVVRYRSSGAIRYFHTDIFLAASLEKPFALFHWTGDTIYNVRTRALAKKQGMLLNQYGIFNAKTKQPVPGSEKIHTEKDITNLLGISYRAPEARNSPGNFRRTHR